MLERTENIQSAQDEAPGKVDTVPQAAARTLWRLEPIRFSRDSESSGS